MAMSTSVKFTNQFADGTTSQITVGEFDPLTHQDALGKLKENVINFNNGLAENENGYADFLVSKTGAKWKRISAVEVTTIERTYIF